MIKMQEDMVFIFTHAAAFTNFHRHSAADQIARGEVLHARGITLHKAFTFRIGQITALTACALCDKATRPVNTGRVELDEFHILNRKACAEDHGITIACAGMRGCCGEEHPSSAASCEDNGLRTETVQCTVIQFPSRHAAANAVFHNEVKREILDEELSIIAQRLTIKRVKHSVTRSVSRRAGALYRWAITHFCCMAAERTLINLALFIPRERHAPML